ncbi:MAG: alpha-E domain-containing protein [Gammaproteobacteria bacterium]|nr:alpha-E domain-containing protein [Gammaproteobacteria bacterium]
MLSRVAEHIYWLSRYVERAENTARLIRVNTHLQLDLPHHLRSGWEPLVAISGAGESFHRRYFDSREATVVSFLIGDYENSSSIIQSLKWARENARTIRDFFPREGWELMNDLYRSASSEIYLGISPRGRYNYLQQVINGVQTLTGMLSGTMSHDEGYEFLRLGRFLERADMSTRLIDVLTALLEQEHSDIDAYEGVLWMNVLESLGGSQVYRRVTQQGLRWSPVLAFLFRNRHFPRSFLYCLSELCDALKALKNNEFALERLNALEEHIRPLQPDTLDGESLHLLIDELQLLLGGIHQEIGVAYFNYPQEQKQSQSQ